MSASVTRQTATPTPANAKLRFDPEALRSHAGEKVFVRGQDYHRNGHVEILAIERGRILAQVAGAEDYATELTGRGRKIGGSCSCPAFEDWGFCKHMVATALAANALANDAEAQGTAALPRIREHLKRKGLDHAVDMIIDLAWRDPVLFRKLNLAATTSRADPATLATHLRRAIDSVTRARGTVDYHNVQDWAAGVEEALDAVAELVPAGHSAVALDLATRAIGCIKAAGAQIDDSGGHCGALLSLAGDIHLAAACAARPDPRELARELFAYETDDDHDAFFRAAETYAEALGEAGLAEYRRLATEAWAKLPPHAKQTCRRQEPSIDHHVLMNILDFFAERDGDVETRIALRARNLATPQSYLQLAEFCLAQGRAEEALLVAEDGLWMFEDERPNERLVAFAASLLAKTGRRNDAEKILRQAFAKAPSIELHAQICASAGEDARAWARQVLRAHIAKAPAASRHHAADLLICALTHEGAFAEAWVAVREHGASNGARQALAQASETAHPSEVIETYAQQIDRLAEAGGNAAYAEAASLLAHMAKLRTANAQAAHVAALKARFIRKRNFTKLLN